MDSARLKKLLRLISKRPDDADLFQRLGKLYRKLGMGEQARLAWEKSLRLDPCDPWTHLFLGNWYFERGDYLPAIERFGYAQMLLPDCCTPYICLADSFEKQGLWDLAEENYVRAVEVEPEDETAQWNLKAWRARQERRLTRHDDPTGA
jgi:tetratricopeptide (TPR) repeat protein